MRIPHDEDPPRVTRLFRTDGGYVPVRMLLPRDRWRPEVRVEIFTDEFSLLRKTLPLVRSFLSMDIDYRGFIRACIDYEGIRSLMMRRMGERPAGHYSRVEALLFIEAFGRHVEIGGEDYWGFPSSEDIRSTPPEELRKVLRSRVRAWAVRDICCSERGEDVFGVGSVARDYAFSRLSGIGCTETDAVKLLSKTGWAGEAGIPSNV